MKLNLLACLVATSVASNSSRAGDDVEKARYLRPAVKSFETECAFTLRRSKAGVAIQSVTRRGDTTMTVVADYDARDRLTAAEAVLQKGEQKQTALVSVKDGTAQVTRDGQPAQTFEVPPGVIVTSAPDWNDVWLLCRRYDRAKGGKQSFPGLWIHPVQACQRLTFAIEANGSVVVERQGKKLPLDRYTIVLRGNSSYAAWADDKGRMIKLVPLPYKEGARNWLVLEGYEEATALLRPVLE